MPIKNNEPDKTAYIIIEEDCTIGVWWDDNYKPETTPNNIIMALGLCDLMNEAPALIRYAIRRLKRTPITDMLSKMEKENKDKSLPENMNIKKPTY